MSQYTIHQAKFVGGELREVLILCRDEPEPPHMFHEEIVVPVSKLIEYMLHGDTFYAQWGNECFEVELTRLQDGLEIIEVAPKGQNTKFSSLANLPCEKHIFEG